MFQNTSVIKIFFCSFIALHKVILHPDRPGKGVKSGVSQLIKSGNISSNADIRILQVLLQ